MCKNVQNVQKCAKLCKDVQNMQNCAKFAKVCKMCKTCKTCKIVQNVQNCAKCAKLCKMCRADRADRAYRANRANRDTKVEHGITHLLTGLLVKLVEMLAHLKRFHISQLCGRLQSTLHIPALLPGRPSLHPSHHLLLLLPLLHLHRCHLGGGGACSPF